MKHKRFLIELIIFLAVVAFSLPLLRPRLAILLNNQGTQYWERGEPAKAVTFFRYSLSVMPTARVYCNLALAYKEAGRISEAIAGYTQALRLDPRCAPAYYGLSDSYLEKQLYEESLRWLKQAEVYGREEVEIREKNINMAYGIFLFNEAAEFYYVKKDVSTALVKLDKAIMLEPDFALSYKLRGDIRFEKGLFSEAIEDYRKALDLGLKEVKIYNLYNDIGISYLRIEDYENAVEYLKKACSHEPGNVHILYTLASTLRDAQKWTEALKKYQELTAVRPDYPNAHNDMAGIYHLMDDEEKVAEEHQQEIETAQDCLAKNPKDVHCLARLAEAYNGLGRYAEAETFADQAIQLDPEYADAFYIRARIYENSGRMEKAVQDLSRAKQLYPRTRLVDNYILRLKTKRGLPAEDGYLLPDTVVYLKNGRKIEGRLKMEDEQKVFIEILVGGSYGTVGIERDNIMSLQRQ